MKTIDERALELLKEELRMAHEKSIIPYYHLGMCHFGDVGIDLYIALNVEHLVKEDEVKQYFRKKYGSILRAISINAYYY